MFILAQAPVDSTQRRNGKTLMEFTYDFVRAFFIELVYVGPIPTATVHKSPILGQSPS